MGSFLVYARPRNAGKTTLARAIVAAAPTSLPRLDFLGTQQEVDALSTEPARGYVQVAEIGHRGRPATWSKSAYSAIPTIRQLLAWLSELTRSPQAHRRVRSYTNGSERRYSGGNTVGQVALFGF